MHTKMDFDPSKVENFDLVQILSSAAYIQSLPYIKVYWHAN